MTEEPRRSGRATKGVNPKNQDEPEPPVSKKKATKAKSKPTPTEEVKEEEEEEEEVIRCVCGDADPDSEAAFMACDNCQVWQHCDCMGYSSDEEDLPEQYYCEECKPEDHKELLAAMARGEKPWEAAIAKRGEKKTKKKGKGGKASKPKEEPKQSVKKSASPAQKTPETKVATPPVPAPAPVPEKGKRKHAVENGADAEEQPTKVRRSSTHDKKETTRQSRQKSEPSAPLPNTAPPVPPPDPNAKINSIAELQDPSRKGCATFMRGKFESTIRDLSKRGEYRIPDGETAASLSESIAVAVEHAMFKNHCGSGPKPDYGGAYKQQMTTIGSNIVQNSTLMLRLLSKSITADQLSKMSSDDMASEELQKQMASMKEEADKQSTLVSDDMSRPLVRRTHKGEELVDDQTQQMTSDSIVSAAPIRRRESNLDGPESPGLQDPRSPDRGFGDGHAASGGSPLTVDTGRSAPPAPPSAGVEKHRKSSTSNFDIKNVWSSVQSPDLEQSPRFGSKQSPQAPWPTTTQIDGKVKNEGETDIDRLLDEDGTDSPPYSPGEVTGPPIIWRGIVDMPIQGGSVARFKAISQHVAGSDLKNKVSDLSMIYPESLELSGRIPRDKADEYLTSLSASRSTDVSVHSLKPADGNHSSGRTEFDKLFKYFTERDRYGVIGDSLHRENVSDTYIIPLEAGVSKMPSFLERLYHNTIENPPPRRMLLVVFILKWKIGVPPTPAAIGNADATPSMLSPPNHGPTGAVSAMSPIATPGSQQPYPIHQPPPQNAATNQQNSYHAYPQYIQPPPQLKSPVQLQNFENARQVLAELVTCPTAVSIVEEQGEVVGNQLWENLKLAFTREPLAQNNLQLFYDMLQQTTAK